MRTKEETKKHMKELKSVDVTLELDGSKIVGLLGLFGYLADVADDPLIPEALIMMFGHLVIQLEDQFEVEDEDENPFAYELKLVANAIAKAAVRTGHKTEKEIIKAVKKAQATNV